MNKSNAVIKKLIEKKVIPEIGEFIITDSIIGEYQQIYKSLYEKVGKELKGGNKKYARKLAGIFLMKENQNRIARIQETKVVKSKYNSECGIVYIISNPSFPNYYKVGITKNLNSRIKSYQTYDPNRSFKVEHYKFVENARQVEKEILSKFKISLAKGEWVEGEEVKALFLEEIKNF